MQKLVKISAQPQLILFQLKPDGNSTFVDFLIVVTPSYTITRLNTLFSPMMLAGPKYSGRLALRLLALTQFFHCLDLMVSWGSWGQD